MINKCYFLKLYKYRSPDGNTDYFDIVAGVPQEDTLAPYLFTICLDYALRMSIDRMKENDFKQTKERSRRYPAQTITYADYADDVALLANTLPSSNPGTSIGLHVNAHKTEYMGFNKRGDISTPNGSSLKLIEKFTYLGNSVSSTETDINTRLAKAWTANCSLSVIWKSDLTDKMKRCFSKQQSYRYCCMDTLHGRKLNVWRKSLTAITQE